ncbi:MAG: alpha/beta fold hydrolase [Rubrobacter sp.]|nr:alpha/beta fold hydrolase [Rubrobacter sp.]
MEISGSGLAGRIAAVGLLAVSLGGVAVYLRPSEAARLAMRARLLASGAREGRVAVDRLPVRYFDSRPGRGDGEAMVLVHGLGGHAESWAAVMPKLSRGTRVLAPDIAGFGGTDAPPEGMSFSSLTKCLGGFLDEMGIRRAVLVGNSLGGAVSIKYVARHPERVERLFLLNSAGLLDEAPSSLEPDNREEARELWGITAGSRTALPNFFLDDMVRRAKSPARRAYLRSGEPTDVREDLPRIEAPTTIIWGARDGLIPRSHGEEMRAAIPVSELVMLPEAAHVPQIQAPEEVVSIIRGRLAS